MNSRLEDSLVICRFSSSRRTSAPYNLTAIILAIYRFWNESSVFSEGPSKWKTLATKIKEDGCTARKCFLFASWKFEGWFGHYWKPQENSRRKWIRISCRTPTVCWFWRQWSPLKILIFKLFLRKIPKNPQKIHKIHNFCNACQYNRVKYIFFFWSKVLFTVNRPTTRYPKCYEYVQIRIFDLKRRVFGDQIVCIWSSWVCK